MKLNLKWYYWVAIAGGAFAIYWFVIRKRHKKVKTVPGVPQAPWTKTNAPPEVAHPQQTIPMSYTQPYSGGGIGPQPNFAGQMHPDYIHLAQRPQEFDTTLAQAPQPFGWPSGPNQTMQNLGDFANQPVDLTNVYAPDKATIPGAHFSLN